MKSYVVMFVLTLASFSLFFFNVPYWTGQEMRDVSKNGIYRCLYMLCSSVGWTIYKILEKINAAVDNILKIKPGGVIHGVLNLLMYVGVVFVLSAFYDAVMSAAIGGEVSELKIVDNDKYSKLSDLLLFWNILNNFREVNSISSFFAALKESFFGIVTFVLGTIIFFSFMYGLLSQKIQELCIVNRILGDETTEAIVEAGDNDMSLAGLGRQLLGSIVDFVNKLSVLRNFKIIGVQIAFAVILALYCAVKTIFGESPEIKEFVMDLLDESGVVATIGSFIISFILAKASALVGRFIGRFLPESVQGVLHDMSVKGNMVVEDIKQKRDEWSSKFDAVYQRTAWIPHDPGEVHEMHLD